MVGPHVVRAGSGRNIVTAETVIRSVAGVHDVKRCGSGFRAITFT